MSLAGNDVARLIGRIPVRAVFLPTRGAGVTPWRRTIVLDVSYRAEGQASPPHRAALVAHELTHVLQRELRDPEFFPGGGLRLSRSRRWLGDSTNFMEVQAYIVGTSILMDFGGTGQANWLATLTGQDALNATRAVVQRHSTNSVYRHNNRTEAKTPGHRIPSAGWDHWLSVLGFAPTTIEHIRSQSAAGVAKVIDPGDLPSA